MTADAATVLAGFRRLPILPAEALLGSAFVVLAPHPDDESLGVGGIIAEACARGAPPIVAILTDGAGSHPGSGTWPPARLAALRRAEACTALAALGLPRDRLHFLDVPDRHAPHDALGVAAQSARLAAVAGEAATILTSWRHDPHGDHLAAFHIAAACCALTGATLLEYPVWGWLLADEVRIDPAHWTGGRIDVSAHAAAKAAAIAAHRSQAGAVIDDDPDGFCLPEALLMACSGGCEVLVRPA